MEPIAPSPTLLGTLATAFLSLIAFVVWALRQQLGQNQRFIEITIPQQQAAYIAQLDKMSDFYRAQMVNQAALYQKEAAESRIFHREQQHGIQATYLEAHKELIGWIKANQDVLTKHTDVLEQHTDLLEALGHNLSATLVPVPGHRP